MTQLAPALCPRCSFDEVQAGELCLECQADLEDFDEVQARRESEAEARAEAEDEREAELHAHGW